MIFIFLKDTYEEGNIQKQESYDEEYDHNLEVIIQEIDTAKKTDQMNEDQEVQMKTDLKDKEELENWVLGCKKMCIDGKQSCYSRIKGVMVACDANIACESNSWFHLSCEGYRRIPAQLADNKAKVQYVCTKCRIQHEKKEELELNKGFMYVENNTDDDDDEVVIEETSYDGKITKEVQYHQLSEEDRNIIIQREWLNDVHINISQALLKKKHPYIDGMENCVLAENNSFSIQRGEFIQIVNSTGQHWVTVTSIGCPVGKVKVYDSSYRRVLRRMRDIIMKDHTLPFDTHRSYFARNAATA